MKLQHRYSPQLKELCALSVDKTIGLVGVMYFIAPLMEFYESLESRKLHVKPVN